MITAGQLLEELNFVESVALAEETPDWLLQKVKNPRTGRMVQVRSLPPEEWDRYRPKDAAADDSKVGSLKMKAQAKAARAKIRAAGDPQRDALRAQINKQNDEWLDKNFKGWKFSDDRKSLVSPEGETHALPKKATYPDVQRIIQGAGSKKPDSDYERIQGIIKDLLARQADFSSKGRTPNNEAYWDLQKKINKYTEKLIRAKPQATPKKAADPDAQNIRGASDSGKQSEPDTPETIKRDLENMKYDIAKTKGRLRSVFLNPEEREFQKKVLGHQRGIVLDLKKKLKAKAALATAKSSEDEEYAKELETMDVNDHLRNLSYAQDKDVQKILAKHGYKGRPYGSATAHSRDGEYDPNAREFLQQNADNAELIRDLKKLPPEGR